MWPGFFVSGIEMASRVIFPPGLVLQRWKAALADPSFEKLNTILGRPSIFHGWRRGTFAFALPLSVAWRRSD